MTFATDVRAMIQSQGAEGLYTFASPADPVTCYGLLTEQSRIGESGPAYPAHRTPGRHARLRLSSTDITTRPAYGDTWTDSGGDVWTVMNSQWFAQAGCWGVDVVTDKRVRI